MKSIKTIYKIGNGPSSSHTVGPFQAATFIKERYPNANDFTVTLYGSLAFTGDGHGTSKAILSALPNAKILNDFEEKNLPHPNTMDFLVKEDGKDIANVRIMSIGGGSIKIENEVSKLEEEIYKEKLFYEDQVFDGYSFIKKLLLSANKEIVIITITVFLLCTKKTTNDANK